MFPYGGFAGFSGYSNAKGVGFNGLSICNMKGVGFGAVNEKWSIRRPDDQSGDEEEDESERSSDESDEKIENSADDSVEKTDYPKKRQKLGWRAVTLEAECCPDAIIEYANTPVTKLRKSLELNLRVKKHLSYSGWKIQSLGAINGPPRVRYLSPNGKIYMSLSQVCGHLKDKCEEYLSAIEPLHGQSSRKDVSTPKTKPRACRKLSVSPPSEAIVSDSDYCPQAVSDYITLCGPGSDPKLRAEAKIKAKKHMILCGWHFFDTVKRWKNKEERLELRYKAPNGKVFISLLSACKWFVQQNELSPAESTDRVLQEVEITQNESPGDDEVLGVGMFSKVVKSQFKDPKDTDKSSSSVLRSCRRARQAALPSSLQTPSTVLSWMIDNNVVLPQAKVQYRKKDGRALKEGKITRNGILCSCCQRVYGLSNFEAHAGSAYHRPSAYIFLEDGRSLFELQKGNVKKSKTEPCTAGRNHFIKHDYICSVCHDGGDLLLCDQCPSAFHTICIGLKEVPQGDWFCPSCCCGICHQTQFDRNRGHLTDNSLFRCYQCEHQYHAGCLKSKTLLKLKWFCNYRCQQIYLGLDKLLGKPIPVGSDNLTWTLLKPIKQHDSDHDDRLMEIYGKLNVALGVMQECFESVIEPLTKTDLVEDIIFNRPSKLNRLNFQGFYTVILEKNDEIVTAAALRVHGEKVAEIPLVATLFKHQRRGMCRVLMKELEKKLAELGVQRLVLPAVEGALGTWTSSFGFAVMTKEERLNFVDNVFLDFYGTVMCQKVLGSRESQNGNSPVSVIFQPEEIGFNALLDQSPEEFISNFYSLG